MENKTQTRIRALIRSAWASTQLAPEYSAFLAGIFPKADPGAEISRWLDLPGWCCEAAGGEQNWADEVASAWFLFYSAAHWMDSIEDHDLPQGGMPASLAGSLATGLYFTASLILTQMNTAGPDGLPPARVAQDFYTSLLNVAAGQHADLAGGPDISLEDYWTIAAGKSGAFFALACRAGASLATREPEPLDAFHRMGLHLGILMQVMDDLEETQALIKPETGSPQGSLWRSLPVIFVRTVAPAGVAERLDKLLTDPAPGMESRQEVYNILDENGAGLFLAAEIEHHRQAALVALDQAAPGLPVGHPLRGMLQGL